MRQNRASNTPRSHFSEIGTANELGLTEGEIYGGVVSWEGRFVNLN